MTLEKLLARELELRECLLRDARHDDSIAQDFKGSSILSVTRPSRLDEIDGGCWPIWCALDELRLVDRRIFQTREAIKQAEEDAR